MTKAVLGVIGGSGLLKSTMVQSIAKDKKLVETSFGTVIVWTGSLSDSVDMVFVQRHAADPEREYSPPHLVPYQAILCAMKKLEVKAILAVCSVGSMKVHIPIGSLVVPDDYFCPYRILSVNDDHRAHTIPEINQAMRDELLNSLFQGGLRPLDGGTYLNSNGPRFETKAEIRFMSQYGDLVGMTGAHEATIAKEVGIPYAMLATVDNMANGVGPKLTMEEFFAEQEKNKPRVEQAVHLMLNHFKHYPDVINKLGLEQDEDSSSQQPNKPKQAQYEPCDTVIHAKHIVTVDKNDTVLDMHAIALKDGKIIDILPTEEADTKYGVYSTETTEVVRLPDAALIPGLINAHTHVPMVFMRGFGDDMKLDAWLTQKIWPAEVRCVSERFVNDGTKLACAEFIRGGTTCFSDMYFFSEEVASVIQETGIRGFAGAVMLEFPSNYAKNAEEYLEKGKKLFGTFENCSRVGFTVSPHSTYAVSEDHLAEAYELSKLHKVPFHIHLHETEREVEDSVKGDRTSQFCHNSDKKCRPLQNLLDNNLVDERLVAVHMVHLTPEEMKILAEKKANVVHCPTSNLKLASGFCKVLELQSAGVNVALGTDGASSNNSLDMFAEMKLAAVLAKGVSGNPEALPATAALRMATINGAKALGIADKVGSLEVGKQADIVAVDLSDISSMPTYTVISHLVYATNRHQVSDVWVDGCQLLKNRQLLTIDVGRLRREAEYWQQTISEVDASHDGTYK